MSSHESFDTSRWVHANDVHLPPNQEHHRRRVIVALFPLLEDSARASPSATMHNRVFLPRRANTRLLGPTQRGKWHPLSANPSASSWSICTSTTPSRERCIKKFLDRRSESPRRSAVYGCSRFSRRALRSTYRGRSAQNAGDLGCTSALYE